MRFAHARPATVTLMAGGVLITATSGLSLAAAMGGTSAWAHPSGYAIAADDAVTAAGDQSCQPFKLPAPPPTATPTPTPTTSKTSTPTSTPTLTPTPPPTATATKTGPSAAPSKSATPTPTKTKTAPGTTPSK